MHRAFCRIAAASFSPAHTFPAFRDSTTYPHVLIDRQTISRHVGWIVVVVLATTAAIVWYAQHAQSIGRLPGGASLPGLVFGIAAAAIMVSELLLWPRKLLRRWRLGSAKSWLRAHIWLGLFTVPLVLLHSGFDWGGTLSTALAVLFILVIASGIFGLAMQQWLPRMMLSELPAETIASQTEHVAGALYRDAQQIVTAICGVQPVGMSAESTEPLAGSEPLLQGFANQIGPFLLTGGRHASLGDAAGAGSYFNQLRSALDAQSHPAVSTLERYCDERRQFDRQLRMHRWLQGWLLVHLPLSIVLIALMFVHAYMAFKYR